MLLQRILFPHEWYFMVVLILYDLHTPSSMIRIDFPLWDKTKDILLEEKFMTSIDRQRTYNLQCIFNHMNSRKISSAYITSVV